MSLSTNASIALVAATASILTSTVHGLIQAVFERNLAGINAVAFVIGRLIGDVPVALLCFGLAYGLSKLRSRYRSRLFSPLQ